jgi:hypothetical protein
MNMKYILFEEKFKKTPQNKWLDWFKFETSFILRAAMYLNSCQQEPTSVFSIFINIFTHKEHVYYLTNMNPHGTMDTRTVQTHENTKVHRCPCGTCKPTVDTVVVFGTLY